MRKEIRRPPGRQEPAAFVLKPYGSTERKELPELLERAADAALSIVVDGLELTQNRFNAAPPDLT